MLRNALGCAALAALAVSCAAPSTARVESASQTATQTGAQTVPAAATSSSRISKILVIPEENRSYRDVIGTADAPYLNGLARRYGLATNYVAGDPASYHSLASYLMMTGGSTGVGVNGSDCSPTQCPQPGDNIFHQLQVAGKRWGVYAESMPRPCDKTAVSGAYAARHTAAPYYTDLAKTCAANDVPVGSRTGGALASDIAAGRLPDYSMAVPNLDNDMHDGSVARGDRWLSSWVPKILRGADYRAGRLAIVITWDEGGSSDNSIATIVISPNTQHVRSGVRYTHYSLLRTSEEVLGLPLLGRAHGATSMRRAFHL